MSTVFVSVAQKQTELRIFFFFDCQTFKVGVCLLGSIMGLSGDTLVSFDTYLRSFLLVTTHFKLLIFLITLEL